MANTEFVEIRISYSPEEKDRVMRVLQLLLDAIKEAFPEWHTPVTVQVDVSKPSN
jgi:hypothetical protein